MVTGSALRARKGCSLITIMMGLNLEKTMKKNCNEKPAINSWIFCHCPVSFCRQQEPNSAQHRQASNTNYTASIPTRSSNHAVTTASLLPRSELRTPSSTSSIVPTNLNSNFLLMNTPTLSVATV